MIAIIDYKAGNLTSVARAMSYLGYSCIVTNKIKEIEQAERIIFPGVGAAGSAMKSLKELGLDKIIPKVFQEGKPIFGICLGTQIILSYSHENDTHCLHIIEGKVKPFPNPMKDQNGSVLKIPHMGWNQIQIKQSHPILADVKQNDEFYFVHGYYPHPQESSHVIASTEYGITFSSVIGFKNIFATQFHPEKSGRPGLTLLKNFCEWNPC